MVCIRHMAPMGTICLIHTTKGRLRGSDTPT
jgi:hypothetical protein